MIVKRFLKQNPSKFQITALVKPKKTYDVFSGHETLHFDCRLGDKHRPVEAKPFINELAMAK